MASALPVTRDDFAVAPRLFIRHTGFHGNTIVEYPWAAIVTVVTRRYHSLRIGGLPDRAQ